MVNVFLLLGSNIGNRHSFINEAVKRIDTAVAPVVKASAIYQTQAWGKTDVPDYLNQVLLLRTNLPAQQILERVLLIETVLGRQRTEKWGSRTIDIDLLFYGDAIIDEPNLQVPHPEIQNRRFTLEPLAELMPFFVHPVLNKNILQIKNELKDNLIVKKYNFDE